VIDFDDELEQAQARLKRTAELMDTAVMIGQIGQPYLLDWYYDLSPADKALLDAKVAEIQAAFAQLIESAARTAEIFAETFREAFQTVASGMQRFVDAWVEIFGGAFLPNASGAPRQYDPHNARSMWKWDPAKARPGKRPLREVRFNQVPSRQFRNGRRGR